MSAGCGTRHFDHGAIRDTGARSLGDWVRISQVMSRPPFALRPVAGLVALEATCRWIWPVSPMDRLTVQAVRRAMGRVSTLPLRLLAATAALYGCSAIAHTSSTNRSPSGARETQGSMAPAARSVAVSRRSR